MLNEDGTVMMEEKEITVPMYRVVSVFDVSQTDGKPLPKLAADLRGDVRYYSVFMEALRRTSPVPMDIAALPPNMDGYFNAEAQEIKLRKGMSETQTFCAAIHEITHATLHDYEKQRMAAQEEGKDPPKPKSRQTEEIEAESVAYTVSQYYGIDTSPNSFGYLAGWSQGKELSELRDSLETINMTAGNGDVTMEQTITYDEQQLMGNRSTTWDLEKTYMIDFIVNLFAEIADFFITFWVDNVIDKFAKKK